MPSMKSLSSRRQPSASATRRATSPPPEPNCRVIVIAGISVSRHVANIQYFRGLEAQRFPGFPANLVAEGTLESHAGEAMLATPAIRAGKQRAHDAAAPLRRDDICRRDDCLT